MCSFNLTSIIIGHQLNYQGDFTSIYAMMCYKWCRHPYQSYSLLKSYFWHLMTAGTSQDSLAEAICPKFVQSFYLKVPN